jgi:hypothetical protein
MIKHGGNQGRDDADRLLASMREWRGAGMTMLLTGSIGLAGLARQHHLNVEHLNDLQPFSVPELSEAEARDFIRQATEGPSQGRWTEDQTVEFLKQAGVFYPCFLVSGLLEVDVERPAAPQDFATMFAHTIRPHLHQNFYNQFDSGRRGDYGRRQGAGALSTWSFGGSSRRVGKSRRGYAGHGGKGHYRR